MQEKPIKFLRKILSPPLKNGNKKRLFLLRRFKRTLLFKSNIILFYPEIPGNWFAIRKICNLLGCKMINDPKGKFHLVINWQDSTFRTMDNQLANLANKHEVCNIKCSNISKRYVDSIFNEVFGYSIMVDPITYTGRCVEKSDLNGKHDGKIIECPLNKIKKECVYQKLIDNQYDGNSVEDIRVPIFKENIPFVYLKYKLINDRFGLSFKGVVAEVDDILTQDEVQKILLFCKKMGLDYGELDVLRNDKDGRLYIVDANNTPSVRFVGFTDSDKIIAFKRLSQTFEKVFIK